MLLSCISILVFCLIEIVVAPPPPLYKLSTTLNPDEDPHDEYPPPHELRPTTKSCQGEYCRSSPNLVGIIVGSLCGILVVALIGVFAIWFYFKRKQQKPQDVPIRPVIKYIEHPPLYTGSISTTDTSSKLYGISQSRNDSIASHLYEKINYNERS